MQNMYGIIIIVFYVYIILAVVYHKAINDIIKLIKNIFATCLLRYIK